MENLFYLFILTYGKNVLGLDGEDLIKNDELFIFSRFLKLIDKTKPINSKKVYKFIIIIIY